MTIPYLALQILTVQIDIGGRWRQEFFWGLAALLVFIAVDFPRYIPWVARILWIYVLVYALYLFEFPVNSFGDYTRSFQTTAGQSFAEVLLIPVCALMFPKRLWKVIPLVMCIEILAVMTGHEGLMKAPSFDTAFMAIYLPFAPLWLGVGIIAAILTHHGTTSILIVIAELIALSVKNRKLWKWTACLAPLLLGVAYFHHFGPWWDGLERIQAYKRYLSFWAEGGWRVIVPGTGPGSFMWMSLIRDSMTPPAFLMMHSDWLQCLFELGAVGAGLILAVFYKAIRNAWDQPRTLAGLFGVAAFAVTYHPLRFMPSAMLVALIFMKAFGAKEEGPSRSLSPYPLSRP